MSVGLRKNRFYGLKINNNNSDNVNENTGDYLLKKIKDIQARYKFFIKNYTTFKDFTDDTEISTDNIFEFDVADFFSKSTLSEKDKIETLKNYKKFLEFVEKTIMKEYLGLYDDNFSVKDIDSKLSNAMKVDKVIEDPIKLYLAQNVNEEDAAIIKEKHKAYLNYKHYYNVKKDAFLDGNNNNNHTHNHTHNHTSKIKSSKRFSRTKTRKTSQTKTQHTFRKTLKKKLKLVKDEYCKENPNNKIRDNQLWNFFELINLDTHFTELCEGENEDTFYDSIKYDNKSDELYESFYQANINAISFYFGRYTDLLEFMKQLSNGNIEYDPEAFTYITITNPIPKLFKERFGEEYFKDKSYIQFFCNEYHTTRNCLLKYKLTLLKYMREAINKHFFDNPNLIVFREILNTNFEEDYLEKPSIKQHNFRIIPIDFDITPMELELKSGIYVPPNIYFQKINDEIIKYICNNVYWSFYDKLIPNLMDDTMAKSDLMSFLNDPVITNDNGSQENLKYQLKLLKTFIKNDPSDPLFEVDKNGDYIGLTNKFLKTFSTELNKLNRKQVVISPLENGNLYHPIRYLFIASLFLITKDIMRLFPTKKIYSTKYMNIPEMNHLFYTKKLNWFVLYLISRNNVDFPIRLDISNIYDNRIEFNEKDDIIFNIAELGSLQFQYLFLKKKNMESMFKGMSVIPYKSNNLNDKISLFFIFYFKIDNDIQNINFRKRFLYDKHINRSFGITADEIKYLLKYSGMSVYKINRDLLQKISKRKMDKTINYYKSLLFFTRKQDSELKSFSDILEKVKTEIISPSKSKYNKLNYKVTYIDK